MTIFKSKTPLTLDERSLAASSTAAAALSVFEVAAIDLELAAIDLDDVATEASAEIARLAAIEEAADTQAGTFRQQADAIRGLVAVHG